MNNLFEGFDAMTSNSMSLNWMMILVPIFLFMYLYWLIPSRLHILWNKLLTLLYNEFKVVTLNMYQSSILILISIFIFIMLMNLMGLILYTFTLASQMSLNLSMSLSLLLSFFIYMWYNKPMSSLSHLVPLNTPFMLMNFMVLIELVSSLIRPLTLAIRLTANLIAGHLLMILLSNFMMNMMYMFPIMIFIQNSLFMLEIFMSFIQSYVFSMLSILYFSEAKNNLMWIILII